MVGSPPPTGMDTAEPGMMDLGCPCQSLDGSGCSCVGLCCDYCGESIASRDFLYQGQNGKPYCSMDHADMAGALIS